MTVASVDVALAEVRPYLIADGGDVTVVDVEPTTGTVLLRLEVSCASARHIESWNHAGRGAVLSKIFWCHN